MPASDRMSVGSTGDIQLLDLETFERKTIIETAFNGRYSPTGHIVFSRDAAIWAVPFDASRGVIIGEEIPVILEVETDERRGAAAFTFSSDGRAVYLKGNSTGGNSSKLLLSWIDREGESESIDLINQQYGHISLSPDETQVAMTIYANSAESDIWVLDISRNTLGRRTFGGHSSRSIWSSDGSSLIYRTHDGESGIYSVASNGTEQPKPLFLSNRLAWPHAISANNELVFGLSSPNEFYLLDLDSPGTGAEQSALQLDLAPDVTINMGPTISPDGNWLAYSSSENGLPHVYVRPFPEITAGKWQASTEAGTAALWSEATNELFYWGGLNKKYSIDYQITDSGSSSSFIEFGLPKEMFTDTTGVLNIATRKPWDYSDTRSKFLMITTNDDMDNLEEVLSQQTSVWVIENWFDEITALAPKDPNLLN